MKINVALISSSSKYHSPHNRISIYLNEPDNFFDGWIKLGIEIIGINKFGIRYVVCNHDFYYCIGDILKFLERYNFSKDDDFFSNLKEFVPYIEASTAKDIYKVYKPETILLEDKYFI